MIAPTSRKLGKYDILHKLGRGGMADVYLAQDTVLAHTVALKLIEHADDADTCDAIEAERRGSVLQMHLAAIDPRVVRIYESGDVDGFFYVAMEYVDGRDLSELMRKGPLEQEFAVDVAIDVAQTLENAHNLEVEIAGKTYHGIVHGDIKPKNIRIDSRGQVRVLDFGIAKALSLSRRLTRNEFGSVPYGSPERLEAGEVNELSDLWSLAVMLYEMMTGLQPYHAESTERLERMIRSRIPPPPAPDPCPEPVRRILVKAMAPDAEVRYQSAHDFRADLMAFRKGDTVRATLEDMDTTRRTFRPVAPVLSSLDADTRRSGAGDETRRTGPDEDTRQTKVWGKDKTKHQKPLPLWFRRTIAGMMAATAVWLVWACASDYLLYHRGAQLEREIASEQLTNPDDIWNKWTELSQGNSSSLLLRGPRKMVKQKMVSAADHVIDSYRNSDTVYETSWKGAREDLAHALALEPENEVRGKLRLAEGHLARINGTLHRSAADLNDAVEKFTEAEHLMPKSPDPALGLARTYVYGLKDIDKAYHALQDAESRGYPMGNREKAYLADGYRDRADRLFWDSRNVRGMPQEKDQIQRAKEDYGRSLELYQAIAPYAGANSQIVRVQNSLESVNFRLQQIEQGSGDGNPLSALPRKVSPWVQSILRDIWQSRAAKQ